MRRYTPDYLLVPFSARDGTHVTEAFPRFITRRRGPDHKALGYVLTRPVIHAHIELPDILPPATLEALVRNAAPDALEFEEYLVFDLRKLDFGMITGMVSDVVGYRFEIVSTDIYVIPPSHEGGADTVIQVVTGC